ncbi:MAG TPA: MG2 domain-containing protein, partial [Chitinophagaceae bacterium]|nr:MG2 domain-containing protein [Chitinophagaceae bacterium]
MRTYRNLILSTLTLLIFMSVKGQQPIKNYDDLWKKVNDHIEKELPKSALKEVQNIYTLAKKEKQEAQIIKSLVFITGLQQQIREDNEVLSVQEIENEITQSKEPARSILKSLLAELYWNYYQHRRWTLYDRTETVNFKKDDIDTWSTDDFHKKIGSLYLESINNTRLLQSTLLKGYDAIIIKGNVRHLRPTLYDLLAHRALDYFENDERDINKPAYAFEINQASAFDPASDFVNRKFPTKDSLSLQQKALLIYQELIRFHLKDAKPDALIDADIKRIQFVNENSTHPNKDNLYFNAINHIAHQYENLPAAAQAWYLVAAHYNEQADGYKPYGDTTFRYNRVKAKDICEKIVAQKDSSEGRINCYNLLNQINSSTLDFNIEKVNEPGKPFRVLVNYKNIPVLHLRLVQATEKLKDQLENRYDSKYWTALLSAPVLKAWEQALPATNDLQEHGTEIKVDVLSPGEYILVAASDKDFDNAKTVVGARLFYISGISYINNGADYFVLDRNNGSPLKNASVQVWDRKYDYKTSKYVEEKGKLYTTDANGFFKLEDVNRDNKNYGGYNAMLDIRYNKDRLFMDDQLYTYYRRETEKQEPKEVISVYLFTDRSIYRPGQTVYFKGIVISKMSDQNNSHAKEGYTTSITLRDANYKNVDTIEVKTNEFGSFSGKFQLPQTGLNGLFSIYTKKDGGSASFRVEEYKRPKFYVDYEVMKGTYKVNDSIKVTGFAKAYAGNNIDGATVKYRVVREPRFIYPWLFRRWWQPPSSPMEITHGEIKTDRDGKFEISFKAIPDPTIDKKFEPVFDYRIYADVTDINGETRSGEKFVSVSYKSLILSNNIPSSLAVDSLKKITIRTQNLNGEFVPAIATVTITKLKEENRLIRNRFWDRPDQFVMSKPEYIKYFPYDEYDNETEHTSWEKGEQVYTATDSSREDGLWSILHGKTVMDKRSFSPGFYMIEITARSSSLPSGGPELAGDEVKDVQYMELFDENNKKLNHPDYLWTGLQKTTVEPGEKAQVELGTAADNLFLVQQVGKQGNLLSENNYQFITLSDEKKTFSFNTDEKDRGGFGVSWAFVKHNRIYQQNKTINVPWDNKDLHIEYATYRDKTLPGSDEKWKIKISGYKNEKVAAEMLATMYDASLDQFYAHAWRQPSVWPNYYNRTSWDGTKNFSQVNSFIKYSYQNSSQYLNKQYD